MKVERHAALRAALGLAPGDLVGIAGAGGKTSLMYRLVREFTASGVPVVATTTTRILNPGGGAMPEVVLGEGNASHIEVLRGLIESRGLALTGKSEENGKIIGHDPEFVDEIHAGNPGWVVVAECDGARGASLKVPGSHEPRLPGLTSAYVVVVGADCIGGQVMSARVYNPDAVADVAGVTPDAPVDDGVIAAAILSPRSYLGRRPADARMLVLVNKVDPGDVFPAGGCTAVEGSPVAALAGRLVRSRDVDGVVLGSVGGAAAEVFAVVR